jgi:uncharacterized protein DUF1153
MTRQIGSMVTYVIGSDGAPLLPSDLPPPDIQRWTIRHKANIVAAVRGGLVSLEDACARYMLTVEEFSAWTEAVDRFGLSGLRATRLQDIRGKITGIAREKIAPRRLR